MQNNIVKKLLSNLSYALCAFFGIFNYIFFAIPYVTAFVKTSGYKETEPANAYTLIADGWDIDFSGAMSALFLVLILIVSMLLLIYGAYGLLKAFDIVKYDVIPAQFCSQTYARYGLYAYAALHILLLNSIVILCISNYESASYFGVTMKAGLRPSFGFFFALILSVGGAVVATLLPRLLNLSDGESAAPRVKISYVCSACGKKVKKGVNFCPVCGGAVKEVVITPTVYVCSNCGKPSKAGISFCPDCGGKIEEVTPTPAETQTNA